MPGILDLPAELIGSIFDLVQDDEDVFAVRLSSKHLEHSTTSNFGRRYFRKKGFLVSTPSLAVLKSVSQHQEFRKYVQHIWFNPDFYTFVLPECSPQCPDQDAYDSYTTTSSLRYGNKQIQQYKVYQECMIDHKALLYSLRLQHELITILAALPNIQTIGMRRSDKYSPWGWRKLKDAIGEDPRVLGNQHHEPTANGYNLSLSGPTHLFVAIVNALASSNVKIQRLYTDALEIDRVPEHMLSQATLDIACRSILYLEINVHRRQFLPPYQDNAPPSEFLALAQDQSYGEGVLRMFKAVLNLKELGLQLWGSTSRPRRGENWKGLYQYVVLRKLAENARLTCLTRVKIERIITSAESLRAVLSPSQASLTSVKIRDSRLISAGPDDRPWQLIFEFFRECCPELAYIFFHHLTYETGGISFVRIAEEEEEEPQAPSWLPRLQASEHFTQYDNITLEARGKEEVQAKMGHILTNHWYQGPMYSYAMDEDVWHTDTSDEEW